MLDFKAIDELAQRLGALLPPGVGDARADIEKNFRAALQAGLGRLDLVTREEFDVQRAVLLRTREKLEQLERSVEELEGRAEARDPGLGNRDSMEGRESVEGRESGIGNRES